MSIRRDGRRQVVDEGPHGQLDMAASMGPVEKVGNQMRANPAQRPNGSGRIFTFRPPKGKA